MFSSSQEKTFDADVQSSWTKAAARMLRTDHSGSRLVGKTSQFLLFFFSHSDYVREAPRSRVLREHGLSAGVY